MSNLYWLRILLAQTEFLRKIEGQTEIKVKHMSNLNPHMNWVAGYSKKDIGRVANTYIAQYRLTELITKGYINRHDAQAFLDEAGLTDFQWEITWPEDYELPDEMLPNRIANVQGYVVWVHGWTGNMHIWEELPGMVVSENRQLVSIAIDHNGFGLSLLKMKPRLLIVVIRQPLCAFYKNSLTCSRFVVNRAKHA